MNERLHILVKTGLAAGSAALTLGTAHAQVVNFTGVNLAAVSSAAGENFGVSSGGFVNVRLLSGAVSAVNAGAGPDLTGFDVQQVASNLTPIVLQFTLPSPQTFVITQNESLTALENNAFTEASNPWTAITSTNATVSSSNGGTQVGFQGTTNNAPYGTYQLQGSGSSFNFAITDSPGIDNYGSAISLNLKGVAAAPEPGSVAMLGLGALPIGLGLLRRRRRARIAG